MTHLWEVKHPYYCNDGNYYSNDSVAEYESWSEYLDEFSLEHTDMDMNLVFRWDWNTPDPDDYDVEGKYGEPEPVPDWEHLHLYHMQQRRGNFQVHIVTVTKDDEGSIREYLSAYADHMRRIWEPIL